MGWRDHVDEDAIRRAQNLDQDLDVEALGASLVPRIESGKIRNPSAVFVVAAREAKAEGKHRLAPGSGGTISPRMEELADLRLRWYAAAARGSQPSAIAREVRAASLRFAGLGLEQEARALEAEGDGWTVLRPAEGEDIPF